jgi:hypothetical protein
MSARSRWWDGLGPLRCVCLLRRDSEEFRWPWPVDSPHAEAPGVKFVSRRCRSRVVPRVSPHIAAFSPLVTIPAEPLYSPSLAEAAVRSTGDCESLSTWSPGFYSTRGESVFAASARECLPKLAFPSERRPKLYARSLGCSPPLRRRSESIGSWPCGWGADSESEGPFSMRRSCPRQTNLPPQRLG